MHQLGDSVQQPALRRAHPVTLWRGLVSETVEMQNAVNDVPSQFARCRASKPLRIGNDAVDGDDEFSLPCPVVESQNVCWTGGGMITRVELRHRCVVDHNDAQVLEGGQSERLPAAGLRMGRRGSPLEKNKCAFGNSGQQAAVDLKPSLPVGYGDCRSALRRRHGPRLTWLQAVCHCRWRQLPDGGVRVLP